MGKLLCKLFDIMVINFYILQTKDYSVIEQLIILRSHKH